MSRFATPVPPPSSFDLAEWISEDWDQEVSRTSYQYRKQSRKATCRRFVCMALASSALLLCIAVWSSAGASHAMLMAGFLSHTASFAGEGEWTAFGLTTFGFVAVTICCTPVAVLCAWREQPVPRHPVPVAVTHNSKTPENSTPAFVNARYPNSRLSSVQGANTLRDLLDNVFQTSAAQVAMQWRTVHAVVAETRTVGTAQGSSRTQLVERWLLHNYCDQAMYHGE